MLTVGATDEQGTKSPSDDVTADWSSAGQTQDGFAKPDVLAPGAHIVSTLAPGSDFASSCPTCVIGGDYFQASGTSLAAPIVAGIAADLAAVHPGWAPSQIKGAIVHTAATISDGGREVNGYAASYAGGSQLTSDTGLTPSTLIDPSTGDIDYSTASWSTASWSTATNPLTASWSTASWSCAGLLARRGRLRRSADRQLEHARLDDDVGLAVSALVTNRWRAARGCARVRPAPPGAPHARRPAGDLDASAR